MHGIVLFIWYIIYACYSFMDMMTEYTHMIQNTQISYIQSLFKLTFFYYLWINMQSQCLCQWYLSEWRSYHDHTYFQFSPSLDGNRQKHFFKYFSHNETTVPFPFHFHRFPFSEFFKPLYLAQAYIKGSEKY